MKLENYKELSERIPTITKTSERYGDLCTIYQFYSFSFDNTKDVDFGVNPPKYNQFGPGRLSRHPCFNNLFRDTEHEKDKTRYLIAIGIKTRLDPCITNFTWMSRSQLEEHISYLKTDLDFDFDFRIEEDTESNTNKENEYGLHYIVIIDTKGKLNRLEIKFLCCWIRYSYEFPSNYLLYDVYRLKNLYPDFSVFNLFLVAAQLGSYVSNNVRPDQCICRWGEFLTNEELKGRLKKASLLMDIYEDWEQSEFFNGICNKLLDSDRKLKKLNPGNNNSSYKIAEFWFREDLFERRKKIYKVLIFSRFLRIKYLKEKLINKAKG